MRSRDWAKVWSTRTLNWRPLCGETNVPFTVSIIAMPHGIPCGPIPFGSFTVSAQLCAASGAPPWDCSTLATVATEVGEDDTVGLYLESREVERLLGRFAVIQAVNAGSSTVTGPVEVVCEITWSQLPKTKVRSFRMGPPNEPPNSLRWYGVMYPLIGSL